jgi:hypothetical protein
VPYIIREKIIRIQLPISHLIQRKFLSIHQNYAVRDVVVWGLTVISLEILRKNPVVIAARVSVIQSKVVKKFKEILKNYHNF